MARGDFEYFDQFYLDEGLAVHNLNANTIKFAIVTSAVIPTRSTPDPRWGPGGTTDFSAQEVTPGGNYLTGGENVLSTFAGLPAPKHDGSVVSWAADPGNPQNAAYVIQYNETAAGKQCIAFADLGGPLDMRAGPLTLTPKLTVLASRDVVPGLFDANRSHRLLTR